MTSALECLAKSNNDCKAAPFPLFCLIGSLDLILEIAVLEELSLSGMLVGRLNSIFHLSILMTILIT